MHSSAELIPQDILEAYAVNNVAAIEQITTGSIHLTYIVKKKTEDQKTWIVLQHIQNIFTPLVMDDIRAITTHIIKKDLPTPQIVYTTLGQSYVEHKDGGWWRAFTYIPGRTLEHITNTELAKSAGKFLGKFHSAVADLNYSFQFSIPHFHDTPHYMNRLQEVVRHTAPDKKTLFEQDVSFIVQEYAALQHRVHTLPQRIIHGDLKVSNIRFSENESTVHALIDLDTLMHHSIAVELGDALRSWCASGDEDTPSLTFNIDFYKAALSGYLSEAHFATQEEIRLIPFGVKLITLELIARFIIDACEESYFVLHHKKYSSLFEQNTVRAKNQLSLYKSLEVLNIKL